MCVGAGDGSRTRDLLLGKQTLYRLSYSRSEARRECTTLAQPRMPEWPGRRGHRSDLRRVAAMRRLGRVRQPDGRYSGVMRAVARVDPSADGAMSEQPRTRVGFIGVGAMARFHLEGMLDRTDTDVVAVCEPSSVALRHRSRALHPARVAGPAERAGLGQVRGDLCRSARRGVHHHPARPPLRPGDGLPGGRPGRAAREADGDDRRRGHPPDRDA